MSTYHVFIGHGWRYADSYRQVADWLDQAQEEGLLTWVNCSTTDHDPLLDPESEIGLYELRGMLKNQILTASTVLIPADLYREHGDWLDYAVSTASILSKKILVLKPQNPQEPLPEPLAGRTLVDWDRQALLSALK